MKKEKKKSLSSSTSVSNVIIFSCSRLLISYLCTFLNLIQGRGTGSYGWPNIEEIEQILEQDTTPEDLPKIKELEESLMQDEIIMQKNSQMNHHHHASVQYNSNHAVPWSPVMSRDESTQKVLTTPRPMQLEIGNRNRQESVKQSPLEIYYNTPIPKQTVHGGGASVRECQTQKNFHSAAPSIESESKKRNNSYEDLPETSSQSPNDKQSKKSFLEHYKEHSSFFDNVKCKWLVDSFRDVPLEKVHFENNDALKTFVPIEEVPNLLDHNTPIYAKLVYSERHNSSNLATWIMINGKYFCNRWHYSSKIYDSSGNYVFNCAGVENKNHGGKRTRGEHGGKTYNKCQGSIWIEVDEEKKELTIGKKKGHTNGYCCLRNLFKIVHDDCRHMACKNESMEDAIKEFKNLLQDFKNHLQNASPSNEEADKEDYFTYKEHVMVNGIRRKSDDLQFFDRVLKNAQKSKEHNNPETEFRIKIMNIIKRASTSTKANDSVTPIV